MAKGKIPYHLIILRKMFQLRPKGEIIFIRRIADAEQQSGMRHRPFIPIHHIFSKRPDRLILYMGAQPGHLSAYSVRLSLYIARDYLYHRKDMAHCCHSIQIEEEYPYGLVLANSNGKLPSVSICPGNRTV